MTKSTRDTLISEAQELFLEKGYDGTSVREIAAQAQVNISSISYYFSGKQGLYQACIEQFGHETLSFGQRVLTPPKDIEEFRSKLSLFSLHMFEAYASRPDIVKLVVRELERAANVECPMQNSFVQLFQKIVDFFDAAQAKGLMQDQLVSYTVASLFMSSFLQGISHDTQRASLFGRSIKDDVNYRKEYSKHITEIFINGVSSK
ncbi:MAG: TetR/AcrR family transcriptional regulator [Bacteriovoracaceae bacterium]|nr:TetR/AcrR family transcriptional regulator [Bacteriovoracaceae bacterium]